jgi:hypothetical protein
MSNNKISKILKNNLNELTNFQNEKNKENINLIFNGYKLDFYNEARINWLILVLENYFSTLLKNNSLNISKFKTKNYSYFKKIFPNIHLHTYYNNFSYDLYPLPFSIHKLYPLITFKNQKDKWFEYYSPEILYDDYKNEKKNPSDYYDVIKEIKWIKDISYQFPLKSIKFFECPNNCTFIIEAKSMYYICKKIKFLPYCNLIELGNVHFIKGKKSKWSKLSQNKSAPFRDIIISKISLNKIIVLSPITKNDLDNVFNSYPIPKGNNLFYFSEKNRANIMKNNYFPFFFSQSEKYYYFNSFLKKEGKNVKHKVILNDDLNCYNLVDNISVNNPIYQNKIKKIYGTKTSKLKNNDLCLYDKTPKSNNSAHLKELGKKWIQSNPLCDISISTRHYGSRNILKEIFWKTRYFHLNFISVKKDEKASLFIPFRNYNFRPRDFDYHLANEISSKSIISPDYIHGLFAGGEVFIMDSSKYVLQNTSKM